MLYPIFLFHLKALRSQNTISRRKHIIIKKLHVITKSKHENGDDEIFISCGVAPSDKSTISARPINLVIQQRPRRADTRHGLMKPRNRMPLTHPRMYCSIYAFTNKVASLDWRTIHLAINRPGLLKYTHQLLGKLINMHAMEYEDLRHGSRKLNDDEAFTEHSEKYVIFKEPLTESSSMCVVGLSAC